MAQSRSPGATASHQRLFPKRLLLLLLLLGACRGGCTQAGRERGGRPGGGALAWFPGETQIVVALDFTRLRASPLWSRLAVLARSNPADQALIDEATRRTGFDPLRQIDSLIVAFPEEARNTGAMGLVLRGHGFDEARLVAYVRDQVSKQGDDLFSFRRDGRTLWATRQQPTAAGFFADDHTFVFGAGGWAEKMAEGGQTIVSGAEKNAELVHLAERAGVTNPVWVAAIVPAATRSLLAAEPALASGGGIARLALGIDTTAGLRATVTADLGTRQQAELMTSQVAEAIKAAKQSPQVLLMGVGPYLDGITARVDGVSTQIVITLSQAQVADGAERLAAFLALARRAPIPGFPHP